MSKYTIKQMATKYVRKTYETGSTLLSLQLEIKRVFRIYCMYQRSKQRRMYLNDKQRDFHMIKDDGGGKYFIGHIKFHMWIYAHKQNAS